MNLMRDFIGAVKERQKAIADSMTNGHIKSFDDYQKLVGQFHGLQESLDILNNLLEEDEKHER